MDCSVKQNFLFYFQVDTFSLLSATRPGFISVGLFVRHFLVPKTLFSNTGGISMVISVVTYH